VELKAHIPLLEGKGRARLLSREVSRIRELPEEERPRERLMTRGPEALSTAELLAILLGTGRPGKSALELAGEILDVPGGPGQPGADRPAKPGEGVSRIGGRRRRARLPRRLNWVGGWDPPRLPARQWIIRPKLKRFWGGTKEKIGRRCGGCSEHQA
jgi:hypothetical protein